MMVPFGAAVPFGAVFASRPFSKRHRGTADPENFATAPKRHQTAPTFTPRHQTAPSTFSVPFLLKPKNKFATMLQFQRSDLFPFVIKINEQNFNSSNAFH